MALAMYQQCNASGKIIGTLAEKGDFNALVAYTGQTGQKLDYMYLLQVTACLVWNHPETASPWHNNDWGSREGYLWITLG